MLRANYPEIIVADVRRVGSWQVFVGTPKGNVDITTVRGITTEIESLTENDPFGPVSGELRFPAVSMLDSLGEGDLWWWRAGYPVDVIWQATEINGQFFRNEVRWEGYIAGESTSFADDGGQVRMTLKGALLQGDNTIVMPEYPQQPYPFELAIAHALDKCRAAGARFGKLAIEWPPGWSLVYKKPENESWWMHPLEIQEGDKWSGMLTRTTGEMEPAVSSYINGLLGSMFTATGQFTLMLDAGRIPVLRHREKTHLNDTGTIDLVTPGLSMEMTCDYETKANVIFGRGKGMDGIAFSNMQFDNTGRGAYYLPFAHHPSVYPTTANPMYAGSEAVRRDHSLSFYDGMSAAEATRVAELYRQRFAKAGHVGTITLTTDPYVEIAAGRATLARHTIRAGDVIRVLHYQGRDTGMQFYVNSASHSISQGTSTLTVDTVFRDYYTTEEVRLRGRDALTQTMSLTTGKYDVNITDQLLPWSPSSGYLPVASKGLFDLAAGEGTADSPAMFTAAQQAFPWVDITKAMPPKDPRYEKFYIKIPPATADLHNNWNNPSVPVDTASTLLLSQAGQIALMQVMAVDSDGNPMKVPFHISIYMIPNVSAADMPLLDTDDYDHPFFPDLPADKTHPYPFFPGAWEKINEDGSLPGADVQQRVPAPNAHQVIGYGTYRVPAGYYPNIPAGTYPTTMTPAPTGMLSVEGSVFNYDISGVQIEFNPQDPTVNSFSTSGMFAVMIYCDSMWNGTNIVVRDRDVYFIGRLFRQPPGTG